MGKHTAKLGAFQIEPLDLGRIPIVAASTKVHAGL